MRFSVVTFVTSLALIQSLYAAPIGESVGKSNPNGNLLSSTFSTGIIGVSRIDHYFESYLKRTAKQVTVLKKQHKCASNSVDTPQPPENVSFQCRWEHCNQSFESVTGLSKHVKQIHVVKGQKYYRCKWENCNFDCFQNSDLQKHLRKHTKERPFVCQYVGCGESFARNDVLKRHIKNVHSLNVQNISSLQREYESLKLDFGEKEHQAVLYCDWKDCNHEFNDVIELTNHVEEQHIRREKSCFECHWKDCSFNTKLRHRLIHHVSSKHTQYRPFTCSYNNCGKSFSKRENLDQHMKIHSNNSYFRCPLQDCDKKYSSFDSIRKHLRVHTAASNLSFSDIESILNAFRKKLPYPDDISNRISSKFNKQESTIDLFENESNQKRTDNENYSEISVNENEGNIYNLESNEFSFSDTDLDSVFSEVTTFDESVTSDKENMEATSRLTECISSAESDEDLNIMTKRPLDCVNNFDYVSKKIKSTHITDNLMDCDVALCLEQNDHQNLQSLLSPLSLKTTLEQPLTSLLNESDAVNLIEQYLEAELVVVSNAQHILH